METGSRTGTTLHVLLNSPTSPDAWRGFVGRYGPKILAWCRGWGLQEADAENVTQEVLTLLARKLATYDAARGRFRGWLRTLTQHALSDYCRQQKRGGVGSGDTHILDQLHSVRAREDLVASLEKEFDREILEEAQARVRLRVAENTWEAFRLTAVEGLSGAEAAERLNMQVSAVFVARSRVQKLLQQEVRRLEGESEP